MNDSESTSPLDSRRDTSVITSVNASPHLSRKFILSIAAVSLVMTLVGTFLLVTLEYNKGIAAVESELQEIELSRMQEISEGLWGFNANMLKTVATGILAQPDLSRVEIHSEGEIYLEMGEQPEESDLVTRTLPLKHDTGNGMVTIGELKLVATLENVRGRLQSQIFFYVLLVLLVILPLAAIFSLLFRQLVGRQLIALTEHLDQIGTDKLDTKLSFAKDWTSSREFERIEKSINKMGARIASAIKRQDELAERLNAHIRHTPVGVVEWDMDARVTSWNPAAERMFGYSETEAMGKRAFDLIVPDCALLTAGDVWNALVTDRGGRQSTNENRTKSGEIRICVWNNTAIHNKEGALTGVASMVQDATDQIRIEQVLRQSEEQLRAVVENSVDAIGVSKSGTHVLVNPAYLRMFGYERPEELIGEPVFQLIAPSERHRIARYTADRSKGLPVPSHYETRGLKKSGIEFDMDVDVSQYGLGDDTHTLVILRDVTERNDLQKQLNQSQKMEAIGTLAGGIAHDFNNILGAIIGYAEIVQQNLPESSGDWENMSEVLAAANRAKELVKQILVFSRRGEIDKRPTQIHAVVEEAVRLLQQTIPKTVEINLDLDQNTGTVLANATQIHQVVINLVTNAHQSMKETGGKLFIRLTPVHIDQTTVLKYQDLSEGEYAQLTVADTGSGMDKETMARVFDPFFTTKAPADNTGMGLSVVHGIVQYHKGAIEVESQLDSGTTFTLLLPLIQEETVEIKGADETLPTGNEHILVVDDEPALANIMKMLLESLGYRATAKTSAKQALATFKSNPDAFDLLLSDQTMPEMAGNVLAQEVMKLRPDLPVIICTGYSEIIDEERAKAMGVRALLMKPISRETLSKAIRVCL